MVHRGLEKLCQTQLTYNEIPFIAERICGICGSVHATSYSQAVEMAAGLKISRRAEYIRTIMLEIERVHSHLLWLGVAGHLIGFDTVFMQAWRVRESIMWLREAHRQPEDLRHDRGRRRPPRHHAGAPGELLDVLETIEKEVLVHKEGHHRRHGHPPADQGRRPHHQGGDRALEPGGAGGPGAGRRYRRPARPPLRRLRRDAVRRAGPDGCDVWATVVVRILETFEAIGIIRQALEKMPADGPLCSSSTRTSRRSGTPSPPSRRRAAKSVHYLITGDENRPERWRVRAPTYPNLQGVPLMLLEDQFADLPIIIGSIDPCFSCTDRVMKV